MNLQFRQTWISLKTSFWFIPAAMLVGAIGLAILMVYFDDNLTLPLSKKYPRLFGANAEGARNILGAIAGSMITVAGVTFSVTIVALSLASNQYTPRILRNFMRDTGNKLVLGVFVSVFVYSLLVLRTIRGGEQKFVPSYSLMVGIVLGVVAIAFLIYFVHHISVLIQASYILNSVYNETIASIDTMFPTPCAKDPRKKEKQPIESSNSQTADVSALTTGYIQDHNPEGLIEWAEKNDVAIEMLAGIGEFAIRGAPFLKVHGGGKVTNEMTTFLNRCFTISPHRTIEQDPAFGIRQIVDVALKALSPGINDTTTAITCLDYLGAILYHLGTREIPSKYHCSKSKVRLISRRANFEFLTNEAFAEIRQHARGNLRVYLHMLQTLQKVSSPELWPERREVLARHSKQIEEIARGHLAAGSDRHELDKVYARTSATLSHAKIDAV